MKWFGFLYIRRRVRKKNVLQKKKPDPSNFLMSTQFIWCSSEFLWAGRKFTFCHIPVMNYTLKSTACIPRIATNKSVK